MHPHLPLLTLYYLSTTLLTSWPFNFSFACSTITCSLTEGVQAGERDVSDRAGGLAEVLCYCCSFIDKSAACLPACLVLSSTRMVLHADQRRVIQQENERAGVGVTEGRKEGCGTVFSLNLEGMRGREARESEVSTGHFFQIPSPQRKRLGGCALRQTREARSCI